jgi:hypothetical protein
VGRLNLVDIDDARSLQNAQVGCFLRFGNQAPEMRLGAITQVVLLDGAITKVEQTEAQAKLTACGPLHHTVLFEDHQKAVRCAFVQLQSRGNLSQTKGRIALREQIENGKCPVQCLNLIGALGACISHCGPQFHKMAST